MQGGCCRCALVVRDSTPIQDHRPSKYYLLMRRPRFVGLLTGPLLLGGYVVPYIQASKK